VLSRRFRRLFLDALEQAHADGQLKFLGDLNALRDPAAFAQCLAPLRQNKWVVYAKPPFAGPEHVIEYLGRYTHRVAISSRRLLAMDHDQVSYSWKDYRDGGKDKVITVTVHEFLRLFLQHSLPPGFQRIRYYGFLANAHRARNLQLCRQLLATWCSAWLPILAACRDFLQTLTASQRQLCPQCGFGILSYLRLPPPRLDTS